VRDSLPKIYSRELVDVVFEQPYCRISNVVEAKIAGRQAASRYLKALVSIGVLSEQVFGREKLFVHAKLLDLLTRELFASSEASGKRPGNSGPADIEDGVGEGICEAPNASTPPSQMPDGVDDYLEHETGLEAATPTLATCSNPLISLCFPAKPPQGAAFGTAA